MPPNKGKAPAGKDAPQSASKKKTGPQKKIQKAAAKPPLPPRNPKKQPPDPFHDIFNRSPSHNEYLEHAMVLKKPKIEEPQIPDVPLPPVYEEPPRSSGGLEDIVESAKLIHRKKD